MSTADNSRDRPDVEPAGRTAGSIPSQSGDFEFDEVLLAHGRLAIITALVVPGRMEFVAIKNLLGMTAGNLSVHANKLEAAGYVRIEKSFVANRPKTVYILTAAGRRALVSHVERLSRIVQGPNRR
jgi:DNA-binding MarR family transcriptional regulator